MSHSIKFVKVITPLALAITLAACGGGGTSFGDEGTSSDVNNAGKTDGAGGVIVASKAASLDFAVSSLQLPSSGKKSITLSAIVKDKNNNTISDEVVTFSVDNGGTINLEEESAGVVKTATLTPGSSKANRTLKVIATVGGLKASEILVEVVGTRINIEGPASITINKQPEYILKLQDSDNQAIASTEVNISTDFGTITPEVGTTDANGEIKLTLNATTNGTANIKAEALNAVADKKITISGNDFALSGTDLNKDGIIDAKDYEVKLTHPEKITIKWLINGVAQQNKTILIRTTRGSLLKPDGVTPLVPSSVKTNSNGEALFAIKSNTAGSSTIIAEAKEGGLTATLNREFIATTPIYLTALASPTLVAPNKSSAIVARVGDKHDNPVKNIAINFNLEDTVNGRLSSAKAITDSLGRAEITYTAGNSSSSLNAVLIKVKLEDSTFNIDEEVVNLTVGGNAVRLTLGHDQLVSPDDVFYSKKFGVIVTDSAGNPVKGKKISFKIAPNKYYKGFLTYSAAAKVWVQNLSAACASEDLNKNDKMDKGEDVNHNNKLEPTHDATVTGSGVTDEQGKIIIDVIYPKNTAWWSEQRIESTTAVNGTEYKEYTDFILPVLAGDVSNAKIVPPNVHSPYGTWGTCSDDPYAEPPVPEIAPPKIEAVNSQTNIHSPMLLNSPSSNLWYAITIDGKRVVRGVDYTIDVSGKVDIEDGPNNDFKLIDKDLHEDDSGYYIRVTSTITTQRPQSVIQPFFYRDNPVGSDGPILTINGLSTIYVNKGSTYKDLGANAVDQKDNVLEVRTYGLESNGELDTSIQGTFTIIYRAVDNNGSTASKFRTVIVKDSDVPVITISGSNNLIIAKDSIYHDSGASAIDESDGDISANITLTGSVSTTTAGIYYISYSVVDSSGHKAVETRKITVDGAPEFTLLGSNPMTIVKDSGYNEPGVTAQDGIDGDISSSIQTTGIVDTATIGTYTVTYTVTDSDGFTSITTREVEVE